MGAIKYIISIAMVALFALAIVTYAIGYADDNNAIVSLSDEEDFKTFKTTSESTIGDYVVEDVNSSSDIFSDSSIETGDFAMTSGGTFKILTGVKNLMSVISSSLSLTKKYIFAGDNSLGLVLAVISGLLVMLSIAYAYKFWVGRNPD